MTTVSGRRTPYLGANALLCLYLTSAVVMLVSGAISLCSSQVQVVEGPSLPFAEEPASKVL